MGAADLVIAGAIAAATGWLLYRSLWKRRGACAGCGGCSRPAARPEPDLVSLGGRPRR